MLVKFIVTTLALTLWVVPTAFAKTIAFAIDNDGVFSTDREYTSGLFLRIADRKPATAYSYSLELGSQIWTPRGINVDYPLIEERPYAGLLYLQGKLNYQTASLAVKNALMLGTTGPNSYAEDIQSFAHEIIGSDAPNGWQYQINNKLVYQYSIEPHSLLYRTPEQHNDVGVYGRAQLGNFQNELAAGAVLRIGNELQNSFGSTSLALNNTFDVDLLQTSQQGYFLYAMAEVRHRFSDLTLEGNKPETGNNSEIKKSQAAIGIGGIFYQPSWGLAGAFIWQSAQYDAQNGRTHGFANLTLFYRF